jgi:hypothetical protein
LEIFVGVNPSLFAVDADLDPDIIANTQPDVVFSFFPANKLWGESHATAIVLTREQTQARCGGLFRIGVADDYSLLPWGELCRAAHMKVGDKRRLLRAARESGSDPQNDWWGTFEPVLAKDWTAVETFAENRWRAQ